MRYSGAISDFHVLPVNDLKPHRDHRDCWCNPTERELGVWVHNSMDRRERTIEKGVTQ